MSRELDAARIIEAARKFVAAREALVEAKFTRHEKPSVTVPLTLAEGEAADALRDALAALDNGRVGMTQETEHSCTLPEPDEERQTYECPVCGRYWYAQLEWDHVYNSDGSEFRPDPTIPVHLRHIPYDR
jgi:hypothetical protein